MATTLTHTADRGRFQWSILGPDRWLTSIALALAAAFLGHAIQRNDGQYDEQSLMWVTAALVLCAAGVLRPALPWMESRGQTMLRGCLALILAYQFWVLLNSCPLLIDNPPGPALQALFFCGIFGGIVAAGFGVLQFPVNRWVPLLLASHFALGLFALNVPRPNIDVLNLQQEAATLLLEGTNPFAVTYPDIYGPDSPFSAPELSVNRQAASGFPYPPLSLLLALPGRLLAGDVRYSYVVATTLSGFFIAYARPSPLAGLAAGVLLFTTRGLLVQQLGWTEPFAFVLLSAIVFCRFRAPRLWPYLLGLLISVKQHMFVFAPAIVLLLEPGARWRDLFRILVKAGVAAVVVNVPFLLWYPVAILRSVWVGPMHHPFRRDALTYFAFVANHGGVVLSRWVSWGIYLSALGAAMWRAPRTPAGFAAAVGFLAIVLFTFSDHAFCNHYYFVIGALCCAVAATCPPSAENRPASIPAGTP